MAHSIHDLICANQLILRPYRGDDYETIFSISQSGLSWHVVDIDCLHFDGEQPTSIEGKNGREALSVE